MSDQSTVQKLLEHRLLQEDLTRARALLRAEKDKLQVAINRVEAATLSVSRLEADVESAMAEECGDE